MGNFYIKLEQAWGAGLEREMVEDLSIGDFGFGISKRNIDGFL
jgi:hypothetical protein